MSILQKKKILQGKNSTFKTSKAVNKYFKVKFFGNKSMWRNSVTQTAKQLRADGYVSKVGKNGCDLYSQKQADAAHWGRAAWRHNPFAPRSPKLTYHRNENSVRTKRTQVPGESPSHWSWLCNPLPTRFLLPHPTDMKILEPPESLESLHLFCTQKLLRQNSGKAMKREV